MISNEGLKSLYEKVYQTGKENFFTFSTEDVASEVIREIDWKGKNIIEIGCGTGDLAARIADAGASQVLAVDYTTSAIETARKKHQRPNLRFEVRSPGDIHGTYDVAVAQEVIEHTDSPQEFLKNLKEMIVPSGQIIVTCPSFLNLRGYVWMTLQTLLQVPMSLSDKHFISPFDVEQWAKNLGLKMRWRTFRYGQAHGEQLISDFEKRLTNALKDAGLDNSRVSEFLRWLDKARIYEKDSESNGAKALYHFKNIQEN